MSLTLNLFRVLDLGSVDPLEFSTAFNVHLDGWSDTDAWIVAHCFLARPDCVLRFVRLGEDSLVCQLFSIAPTLEAEARRSLETWVRRLLDSLERGRYRTSGLNAFARMWYGSVVDEYPPLEELSGGLNFDDEFLLWQALDRDLVAPMSTSRGGEAAHHSTLLVGTDQPSGARITVDETRASKHTVSVLAKLPIGRWALDLRASDGSVLSIEFVARQSGFVDETALVEGPLQLVRFRLRKVEDEPEDL